MGAPAGARAAPAAAADGARWLKAASRHRSSLCPPKDSGRYVVIDGYKRIAALEQLRPGHGGSHGVGR